MRRTAVAILTVLSTLTTIAVAKFPICDVSPFSATWPDVAWGSGSYIVVWEDNRDDGPIRVRGAWVSPQAEVTALEHPIGEGPDARQPAVAAGNEGFLAVWHQPDGDNQALHVRMVSREGMEPEHIVPLANPYRDCEVGFCPTVYLVVWSERDGDWHSVRGSIVSELGEPGDPFVIHSHYDQELKRPRIASNGSEFLVVWTAEPVGGPPFNYSWAARVSSTGEVLGEPFKIHPHNGAEAPDVSCHEGVYLIPYQLQGQYLDPPIDGTAIVAKRYNPAVGLEEDPFLVSPPIGGRYTWLPSVCFSLENHLVAYRTVTPQELHARHVSPGGVAVGDEKAIASEGDQYYVRVASEGINTLAVWDESDGSHYSIWADTIRPWQDTFVSDRPEATAYNEGRSLALDPTNGNLHMVYNSGDSVYYSYSVDGGENWFPWEFVVFPGRFPSIACENQEQNPVWVCCEGDNKIICKARLGPGKWASWDIAVGQAPKRPAMSMCHIDPGTLPAVYLTYVANAAGGSYVGFNRVSLTQGVCDHAEVASPSPLTKETPSISTTPGDFVHVTWKVWNPLGPGGYERVFYRQRTPGGVWLADAEEVSSNQDELHEPAFNPYVEAFGDRAHVVWRAPGDPGPDEDIWRRFRDVEPYPPHWGVFQNRSQLGMIASDFPQHSTDEVTMWQEDIEIWVNVNGFPELFNDESSEPSRYPSVVAVPPQGPSDIYEVNAIWSEHRAGHHPLAHQVKFLRRNFTATDAGRDLSYYDCAVGDSTRTPYCVARDGFARWREYSVDFARGSLRYRLPYLNPNLIYRIRAVVYHTARDTWRESFRLNGIEVARATFRSLQPETVWVTIPQEQYRRSCEVTLHINRLAGEYATVAELKLFQFHPYRQSDGYGGGGAFAGMTPNLNLVHGARPAVFRNSTTIAYSLAMPCEIRLEVFDVQGRMVSNLASGWRERGDHRVVWDGTDSRGTKLSTGAYFWRLTADGCFRSGKLVLAD